MLLILPIVVGVVGAVAAAGREDAGERPQPPVFGLDDVVARVVVVGRGRARRDLLVRVDRPIRRGGRRGLDRRRQLRRAVGGITSGARGWYSIGSFFSFLSSKPPVISRKSAISGAWPVP